MLIRKDKYQIVLQRYALLQIIFYIVTFSQSLLKNQLFLGIITKKAITNKYLLYDGGVFVYKSMIGSEILPTGTVKTATLKSAGAKDLVVQLTGSSNQDMILSKQDVLLFATTST